MLKMEESPWGRRILAAFACADMLEQNSKSDKELYRQSGSYITDSELDKYLREKQDIDEIKELMAIAD